MTDAGPRLPENTLSADILAVFEQLGGEAKLGDLVRSVEHKGFGFLFVILNVPTLIPASSGFVTPFGILTTLLAAQIWTGRDVPWFPEKMLEKPVGKGLRSFLTKIAKTLAKLEARLKPRLRGVYKPKVFRFVMAPLIVLCGVSVAVPLPGTNSIAGLAVLLIGLGMLEEDGVFALAGIGVAILGLLGAVISVYFLVVYGPQGIDMLRDTVFGR